MKRTLTRIFVILSMCLIIVCSGLFIYGNNVNEVSRISYEEANYKDSNIVLLSEVKKLQDIAVEYKDSNGISTSTTELVIQYLRRNRYGDTKPEWVTFLGNVDSNFVTYVNNHSNKPNIDDNVYIYDLSTGKEIDFIHTMAAMMVYIKHDGTAMAQAADYAGWAGDLTTLLEEVVQYRLAGTTNTVALQLYSDSIMGTNKGGSFSAEDALGDLDALNLYKDSTNNIEEDLYTALYNYYVSLSAENNSSNRMEKAYLYLGGSDTAITTLATGYLSQTTYRQMLIPATSAQVTSADISIAVTSFMKYMKKVPYVELEQTSSNETVGVLRKVKVYESNLDDETITVEPNIATVERKGYEYLITPTEAGSAVIKIYANGSSSPIMIYNLTSVNVAPSINTDLLDSYDLVNRVKKEIVVEALGTNNVYTWYISDKEDGEFTVLATTTEPRYEINPTMDLNGKYIKCGIKNTGNSEVFTKVSKLNVEENPIVDTGDFTIPFAIAIILLILGANVIYNKYIKRKPITNLIVK